MALRVDPILYEPLFKDNMYQDTLPFDFRYGILCPCCARTGKIYEKRNQFKQHCTTQRHKKWLGSLNDNRINYYTQVIYQEKTIKNQQIQLTELQNKITSQEAYIKYLEDQICQSKKNVHVENLLELDM